MQAIVQAVESGNTSFVPCSPEDTMLGDWRSEAGVKRGNS